MAPSRTHSRGTGNDAQRATRRGPGTTLALQARQPKPPAIQLFDVLPIKGVLRPGESVVTTFSFFAYPGVKASVTAMCLVEGGPTYQVRRTTPRLHAAARPPLW